MAVPDTSPALILRVVDNAGAHDEAAAATITLESGIGNAIPFRCLCMSPADVLRASPPSLGTACATTSTTGSTNSTGTRTVHVSSANNQNYNGIDNESFDPVPVTRLREFAEFLRGPGGTGGDPRFVASCPACVKNGGAMGWDAGMVPRGEADVKLGACAAYIQPAWGAMRDFASPNAPGVLFWTYEHGKNGGDSEHSPVPDSTFWIAVEPVSVPAAQDTLRNNKGKREIASNTPSKPQFSTMLLPSQQNSTPTLCLRLHAIIEFKRPGALSTMIVHDHTIPPRHVRGASQNWVRLSQQLHKYAKAHSAKHQVVINDQYSIYIQFGEADCSDDLLYFIVPHEQKGAGIWMEDVQRDAVEGPGEIRLNCRELICFLIWSSLRGLPVDGMRPTLSQGAIQKIQERVNSSNSKKHGRSPSGAGTDKVGAGERPPKRLASMGKKREGDGGTGAGASRRTDRGNEEKREGNRGAGHRHTDWSDEEARDLYGFSKIAKQSTGYLPPPGTIFQLIPKPTMTGTLSTGSPQLGDDSGFWEVDEAESPGDRSLSSTPTEEYQDILGTEDTSRTILTKAINHLTKGHQGFLGKRTGAKPLTVRMLCLLAPNVGIAEFLHPDTEEVYTTASILPNASSQVFPLSCILKSHPQHPRLNPVDSYLGEYQAYQGMSAARVKANPDSSTSTFPAGLPAFFGAWDYSPRSTGTALFPILLLENLRACPLYGMTLEEWVGTRHPPPAEKLDMLNEMMQSVETTLKWVQEKCDTVHRDLPGGNGGNLVVLSGGQEKIPVVVVVDWGLAATGEVFPGERLEDAQNEDQADGRSVGPDGEIIRSKRTVPAVTGWGRSDITFMKGVFGDVRTWLEGIVEDEGPVEEEEEELEEEGEEGAPTPAPLL